MVLMKMAELKWSFSRANTGLNTLTIQLVIRAVNTHNTALATGGNTHSTVCTYIILGVGTYTTLGVKNTHNTASNTGDE